MTHQPQAITIVDPRTFDGNPYQVAGRAVAQARSLAFFLELSLQTANLMARNADMERALDVGDSPDATAWPDSPQGRKFAQLEANTRAVIKALTALETAAVYDPKHPPK